MPRPITIEDLYRLQHIEEPQFTPDGRHIAYVRVLPQRESNDYQRTIWLVARDGRTPPLQLTRGGKDSQPRWSPDGQYARFCARAQRMAKAAPNHKFTCYLSSRLAVRRAHLLKRAQWHFLAALVAGWTAARVSFPQHDGGTGRRKRWG